MSINVLECKKCDKTCLKAGHDIPAVKKGNSRVVNSVETEMSKKPRPSFPGKESIGNSHGYKN